VFLSRGENESGPVKQGMYVRVCMPELYENRVCAAFSLMKRCPCTLHISVCCSAHLCLGGG